MRPLRLPLLVFAVMAIGVAMPLVGRAGADLPSHLAQVQLQLAALLFDEGRYVEAERAFERARQTQDVGLQRLARLGLVRSALRVADFTRARSEAHDLVRLGPRDSEAMALYADTLWAAGLFDEAEATVREALALAPDLPRGRHALARSLVARNHLAEALWEATTALSLAPRDAELHHTLGTIYERLHRFPEAADAFSGYVNLLPGKDRRDSVLWSQSQVAFLRSFGSRVPFEVNPQSAGRRHTVPFELRRGKVILTGRINNGMPIKLTLDTGAEQTAISRRMAQRAGVTPIVQTLTAGVGEVGLRGLQLGRIDTLEIGTLKVRNVPCLIKSPALRDLPTAEGESFSPLAMGLSMVIDYTRRQLTLAEDLPPAPAELELPLRLYRLATVRGTVGSEHPANFVVDTGGEVISISESTARALGRPTSTERRIALKVYGTSGWDRDAYLLPGVDLAFDTMHFRNFSVVVLNLRAPSVLLGFQVGGIIGYRFFSDYKVGIDLRRGLLSLSRQPA